MQFQNQVANAQHLLRRKMVFSFQITGNATPASKVHASDLPGLCFISSQSKDDAGAVETISGLSGYASPTDSTGTFEVLVLGDSGNTGLVKGSGVGVIKKLLKATIFDRAGTTSAVAVTPLGSSFGLTPAGNLAFKVVGTGLNLASANADLVLELDFILAE